MEKHEVIEKIWLQMGPSIFISKQDFVAGLEGWNIQAREIDGTVIGATLTRGPEFHFVTFGLHKALPASLIINCLQPIIDEHGYVITRTPKEDMRQQRFNKLIGFCADSEDEFYTYFKMQELNIYGGRTCLS